MARLGILYLLKYILYAAKATAANGIYNQKKSSEFSYWQDKYTLNVKDNETIATNHQRQLTHLSIVHTKSFWQTLPLLKRRKYNSSRHWNLQVN